MQSEAFQAFLAEHQAVRDTLQRASQTVPAKGFTTATEIATLVLLFPLVRYLLMEIGLPWLTTLKHYSEVQRQRVEEWIDHHAASHGLNPDEVDIASRQLMADLEQTTEVNSQKQWEHLKDLMD